MPSDLLSKIRELRGKATAAPWEYDRKEMLLLPSPSKMRDPNGREGWCGEASNGQDGRLIVLLVNHLDEIEKALEEHHAMDAVWPIQRSPKTRDELDRWTIEAQKEADEWSGMKRPVHMTKPDGLMHADPSNDPRTLGERLKGGE